MKVSRIEHMCEGNGHVIIKEILEEPYLAGKCGLYAEVTLELGALLNEEERGEHCRIFSQVTIEPGCELGYHEHHGESETYYILAGQGEYNDNGAYRPVSAGDITYTSSGKGHGLSNTGNTDLVFMALIIKD